jgi:hypothetical protein
MKIPQALSSIGGIISIIKLLFGLIFLGINKFGFVFSLFSDVYMNGDEYISYVPTKKKLLVLNNDNIKESFSDNKFTNGKNAKAKLNLAYTGTGRKGSCGQDLVNSPTKGKFENSENSPILNDKDKPKKDLKLLNVLKKMTTTNSKIELPSCFDKKTDNKNNLSVNSNENYNNKQPDRSVIKQKNNQKENITNQYSNTGKSLNALTNEIVSNKDLKMQNEQYSSAFNLKTYKSPGNTKGENRINTINNTSNNFANNLIEEEAQIQNTLNSNSNKNMISDGLNTDNSIICRSNPSNIPLVNNFTNHNDKNNNDNKYNDNINFNVNQIKSDNNITFNVNSSQGKTTNLNDALKNSKLSKTKKSIKFRLSCPTLAWAFCCRKKRLLDPIVIVLDKINKELEIKSYIRMKEDIHIMKELLIDPKDIDMFSRPLEFQEIYDATRKNTFKYGGLSHYIKKSFSNIFFGKKKNTVKNKEMKDFEKQFDTYKKKYNNANY